jgi:hypothetical protein
MDKNQIYTIDVNFSELVSSFDIRGVKHAYQIDTTSESEGTLCLRWFAKFNSARFREASIIGLLTLRTSIF